MSTTPPVASPTAGARPTLAAPTLDTSAAPTIDTAARATTDALGPQGGSSIPSDAPRDAAWTPSPAAPSGPTATIALRLSVRSVLSWTAARMDLPLLSEMQLIDLAGVAQDGLQLELWTEPALLPARALPLPALGPHEQRSLAAIPCGVALDALTALDGPITLRLCARVPSPDGSAALWRESWPLRALPPTFWAGATAPPELLLCHVQPQLSAFDGCFPPPPSTPPTAASQRARLRVVLDAWTALRAASGAPMRLDPAPPRWWEDGQPLRGWPALQQAGAWTPLERAACAAALAERAGLDAQLVLSADGPRLGCWLEARPQPAPLQDDPAAVRTRVDQGELLIIDLDVLGAGAALEAAAAAGKDALRPGGPALRCALDIAAGRRAGLLPLPSPLQAEAAPPPLPVQLGAVLPAAAPTPAPAARDRVRRWADQLLDLSTRNRLLSFKDGKAAVPLLCPEPAALEDLLAGGTSLRLLERPAQLRADEAAAAVETGRLAAAAAATEALRAQLRVGFVHSALSEAEHRARLLEMFREERTAVQETGAGHLYLAVGALRWRAEGEAAPRRAPVLLIPAALDRVGTGPGARFGLRARDEETRINLTLLRFLEQGFGLPCADLEALPLDGSGVDLPALFHAVRTRIEGLRGWELTEEVWLSRFSFSKLLMWMDLNERREALAQNPVVQHILSGGLKAWPWAAPPVEPDQIEAQHPPGHPLVVREADPSQLQAILAAEAGSSFVLEGPPGTGKSQTITNLIAHLLGLGRTVLFVSEKKAALDVVHKRLKEAGLDRAVLELHSNKANKKAVLEQLKAALAPVSPAPDDADERATLAAQRARLGALAAELSQRTAVGLSVHAVLDRLVPLAGVQAPRLSAVPAGATPAAWTRAATAVERAAAALGTAASIQSHPLRAVGPVGWSPKRAAEADAAMHQLITACERHAAAQAAAVLATLGQPAPVARAGAPALTAALLDLTATLYANPGLSAATIRGLLQGGPQGLAPDALAAEAETAIAPLQARAAAAARMGALFADSVLGLDLVRIRGHIVRWADAFFLFSLLMLWGTRGLLARHARAPLPPSAALTAPLDAAIERKQLEAQLAAVESERAARWGTLWRGAATPADTLRAATVWAQGLIPRARGLAQALGMAPAATADALSALSAPGAGGLHPDGPAGQALIALAAAQTQLAEATSAAQTLLQLDVPTLMGSPFDPIPTATVLRLRAGLGGLRAWSLYAEAEAAARALGMDEVIAPFVQAPAAARPALVPLVEYALLDAAWREASVSCPQLLQLQPDGHAAAVEAYRAQERALLRANRARLAARLAASAPTLDAPGPHMALLRRQFSLQKSHMAIRRLVAEAQGTLLRLKPCVLMSPLSVAQYLDPSLPPFDVVVFDEASQIPPWDAIGAIARGTQVVVVGDSRQLPPTTFFGRADGEDEAVEDDDLVDTESILAEARGAGLPALDLRWHYRSRHEALIAFSNQRYYEGRLVTFPAPVAPTTGAVVTADTAPLVPGLHLITVPDGVYDRGGSRTNRREAERAVQVLRAVLAERPARSVGVVTFSQPQQRLIEDLLDAARAQDPSLDAAFAEGIEDGPFIKNLENVQGDERDVMIFSIGYARDADGRLGMNFGPLNRRGGERRLNVAITRAKERLYVVSTLRAEDIDPSRTTARGVLDLRAFLDFAARGSAALDGRPPSREPSGGLRSALAQRLTSAGWTVHADVGVAGMRLPLAVVHPDDPQRYVAAVLDDGPEWHTRALSQEREHLRPLVLESLGWALVRAWTQEWLLDADAELARVCAQLDAALATERARASAPPPAPFVETAAPPPVDPLPGPTGPPTPTAVRLAALPPEVEPYADPPLDPAPSGLQFFDDDAEALIIAQLRQLGAAAPWTPEGLSKRVAVAWGTRSTARLKQRVAALAPAAGLVLQGDALWREDGPAPDQWSGWRTADPTLPAPREPETLPLVERRNALRWLLGQGIDLPVDDLLRAGARTFGFAQLGRKVREALEEALDALVAAGQAEVEGERVRLPR